MSMLPSRGIREEIADALARMERGELPGLTLITYEQDGQAVASHAIDPRVPWTHVAAGLRLLADEVELFPEACPGCGKDEVGH